MKTRFDLMAAIGKAAQPAASHEDRVEALLLVAATAFARAQGIPGEPKLFAEMATAARDAMQGWYDGSKGN